MISEVKEGSSAVLAGWIHEIRVMSKMTFLLLRDSSGILQCVIKDELMKEAANLTLESVIEIEGAVNKANVRAELARKDVEVHIKKIKLLNKAETLPIQVNEKTITTELPNRLDHRNLDVRKPKISAIFKIQSEIANSFRKFFYKKGFTEIQPPFIIGAASEGGSEVFEVKYFEKKGYLAQSPQLYKQMMACSLERVFALGPAWRAEKHNTTRHINEIRQMDVEVAFTDQMQIMKLQEEVLQFIITNVKERCTKELELLGRSDIKTPKGVYLHYEEAKKKVKGKIGEDFTPEEERKLCEMYPGDVVFTHSWPAELKVFYIMPKEEKKNAKESCGFDSLYGGVEISSGGQRIHLPELLIERMKAKGVNPKDMKEYIDSFRYGAPPHSGWALGLERLTQMICGLDNIKEATLFPRDRDRLTP